MDAELIRRKIELAFDHRLTGYEDYASIIVLERSLVRIQNDMREKVHELAHIIGQTIGEECEVVFEKSSRYDAKFKSKSLNLWLVNTEKHPKIIAKDIANVKKEKLEALKEVFDSHDQFRMIMSDYHKFMKMGENQMNLNTNIGVYMNLYLTLEDLVIHFVDDETTKHPLGFPVPGKNKHFIYAKDFVHQETSFTVFQHSWDMVTKEEWESIYPDLRVDISSFPESFQELVRNHENLLNESDLKKTLENEEKLKLEKEKQAKAYRLLKQAIVLLQDTSRVVPMDKMRVPNLEEIIFEPREKKEEPIRFVDYFKNNKILRMIDLSLLDLTDVDIRGMDFSNTNIHIDPQKIWQKDMSDVNCTNVKFSPFRDSFDDVRLDGTIINDHEARIDLSKVRSFDETTKIKSEIVEGIQM